MNELILVVDDDPDQRRLMEGVLHGAGHHALTAPDGKAGIATLGAVAGPATAAPSAPSPRSELAIMFGYAFSEPFLRWSMSLRWRRCGLSEAWRAKSGREKPARIGVDAGAQARA